MTGVVQNKVLEVQKLAFEPARPSQRQNELIACTRADRRPSGSEGNRGKFGGRLFGGPLTGVCISEGEPFFVAPGGFRVWGKS
jgi:hypothetical protein